MSFVKNAKLPGKPVFITILSLFLILLYIFNDSIYSNGKKILNGNTGDANQSGHGALENPRIINNNSQDKVIYSGNNTKPEADLQLPVNSRILDSDHKLSLDVSRHLKLSEAQSNAISAITSNLYQKATAYAKLNISLNETLSKDGVDVYEVRPFYHNLESDFDLLLGNFSKIAGGRIASLLEAEIKRSSYFMNWGLNTNQFTFVRNKSTGMITYEHKEITDNGTVVARNGGLFDQTFKNQYSDLFRNVNN
jgi:hypothetical protein